MTIALTIKVNDGIVLAGDSASTLATQTTVLNVYNNANKIFNLCKGLPIGLITWGLGSIGGTSISTLAKDLRWRFSGEDPAHIPWKLDPATYTLKDVADRVREFMYDEKYVPADQVAQAAGEPPATSLGFFVAGYSAGADQAEEYHLDLSSTACDGPTLLRQPEETWSTWAGQPECISRILSGLPGQMPQILVQDLGVAAANVDATMALIGSKVSAPMVHPAMPIQDAIDLAEFLVGASIQYSRFMPGSPTVGGPIESAAISKHEGFRWIKRKHYYDKALNPEVT